MKKAFKMLTFAVNVNFNGLDRDRKKNDTFKSRMKKVKSVYFEKANCKEAVVRKCSLE